MSQQNSESQVAAILSTISNYRKIAENKDKRYFLAKDQTCVQFLAFILEERDPEIIFSTLIVLKLLVEDLRNAAVVGRVFGVKQALQELLTRNFDDEILTLAKAILEAVESAIQSGITSPNPLRETQNRTRTSSSTKRSHGSRSVQVVLQIQGIKSKMDREKCVDLLVKVKGVVSIMFDSTNTRCTIRTKREVAPDALINVVEGNRMFTACQLVKNDNGVEMMKPRIVINQSPRHNVTNDKENSVLPDYLPEEDDDFKSGGGTMARSGNYQSSTGSWFNSAASFLTKSFYW